MCTPDDETLFLNGPLPARISRVIVRVTRKVTTYDSRHRTIGQLLAAGPVVVHQDIARPPSTMRARAAQRHENVGRVVRG